MGRPGGYIEGMIEIRSLADESPEALLALWQRAGLHCRPVGRDHPDRLAAEFARNRDLALGAYREGALVGAVMGTDDGRKGWINRLVVDPVHQRQGVAGRLLAAVEAALEDRGRTVIAALIEDWNEPSLALFDASQYVLHADIHYLSKRRSPDA